MKPDDHLCTWIACPTCTSLCTIFISGEPMARCPVCSWQGRCVDTLIVGPRFEGSPDYIFAPVDEKTVAMPKKERQAFAARLLSAIRARQNAAQQSRPNYQYPAT